MIRRSLAFAPSIALLILGMFCVAAPIDARDGVDLVARIERAEGLKREGRFAEAVDMLERAIANSPEENESTHQLRFVRGGIYRKWADTLLDAGDAAAGAERARQAIEAASFPLFPGEDGKIVKDLKVTKNLALRYAVTKASALRSHARAFRALGEEEKARAASLVASILEVFDGGKPDFLDPCQESAKRAAARWEKATTGPEQAAILKEAFTCIDPMLALLRVYQPETNDPLVVMGISLTITLAAGLRDYLDVELSQVDPSTQETNTGSRMFLEFAEQFKAAQQHSSEVARATKGMFGNVLFVAAKEHWKHVTSVLPTLSTRQQRRFIDFAKSTTAMRLVDMALGTADADPRWGLQGALLHKQIFFEASRQDSASLRAALRTARPEWRASWRELDQLRRQYATESIAARADSAAARSEEAAERHERMQRLADEIERRDGELRRTNEDYATHARSQEITLEQISAALRHDEALIEYVRIDPSSSEANSGNGAREPHYAAFVLRTGMKVTAIDLGPAAAIDTRVEAVRRSMQEFITREGRRGLRPRTEILRRSESQIGRASAVLRGLVWDRLAPALTGARRVYVAPDDRLALVPFEILATKRAGGWRYLVEERELVYLGTGRDLARLAASAPTGNSARQGDAVLLGDPSFDAEPEEIGHVLAQLPPASIARSLTPAGDEEAALTLGEGGATELPRSSVPRRWRSQAAMGQFLKRAEDQLRRLGWSVRSLSGVQASEETAMSLQGPRVLQILTHGYLLDPVAANEPSDVSARWENPLLRSLLILAGANKARPGERYYRVGDSVVAEAEARARGLSGEALRAARIEIGDGFLTAYEVTGMDLQGTELVNLTACETGLGQVTPDGVASLRQAFLLAGARAVTTSLWELPTAETLDQMEHFYERWLGPGKDASRRRYVSFRQAQLAAMKRARHPFYWAGVVYVGDPGDLVNGGAAPSSTSAKPAR